MQTQRETILQLLNGALWVCGTGFQSSYIPEYRTRINELRKEGFTIETRKCQQHRHKGIMQEWHLATKEAVQDDKRPVQEKTPSINDSVRSQPILSPPARDYQTHAKEYCCWVYRDSIENHYKPWHTIGCKAREPLLKAPEKPQPKQTWKNNPDFHRPIHTCCPIAIACYEKNLPVSHAQGCEERQAAIK